MLLIYQTERNRSGVWGALALASAKGMSPSYRGNCFIRLRKPAHSMGLRSSGQRIPDIKWKIRNINSNQAVL
jgi:hypothetical protein